MGSRPYLLGQLGKNDRPSDGLEIAFGLELLGYGKRVNGDMRIDKMGHCHEYHPVLLVIETVGSELFHRIIHAVGLHKKGPEDSLFDIKSLRRSVSHLKP